MKHQKEEGANSHFSIRQPFSLPSLYSRSRPAMPAFQSTQTPDYDDQAIVTPILLSSLSILPTTGVSGILRNPDSLDDFDEFSGLHNSHTFAIDRCLPWTAVL